MARATDYAKHPLNSGFEWCPIEGPFRRLSQAHADQYNEQGFFVLEDAVPPALLDELIREIDPFEEKTEEVLAQQEDGRLFINRAGEITFTAHMVRQSTLLREFVSGPVFEDLVYDVLGPDVRLYWDQAVYKKPDTRDEFPWHQDNGYTFIDPQQYLTCWVALTDATPENGCPQILPGLHRAGTLAHELTDLGFRCLPTEIEGVETPLRAGSMVVLSSLTPHRTGSNTSQAIRKAYIVQFAPDGVEVLFVDGEGAEHRIPASAPDRQFPILVAGQSV